MGSREVEVIGAYEKLVKARPGIRPTGREVARAIGAPETVVGPLLSRLRRQGRIPRDENLPSTQRAGRPPRRTLREEMEERLRVARRERDDALALVESLEWALDALLD